MLSLSVSKIVGAVSKERWSQVHSFEPSQEKLASHGALLLTVTLEDLERSAESELDLPSFGKEVLQRFHELYYGAEIGDSVLEHLRGTLRAIVDEFAEVRIEGIAGVILPTELPGKLGICYLAGVGSGSALALRQDQLYRVIEVTASEEGKDAHEIVTSSGFVLDGDVFFLGTGDFFRLVSLATLKNALSFHDPQEVSSFLAPQVHGSEDNSGVAAVVALVRKPVRGVQVTQTLPEEETSQESVSEEHPSRSVPVLQRIRGFASHIAAFRIRTSVKTETQILVKSTEDRRRRLMFSVAFALLLLLLLSVIFGWRQRVQEERERVFGEVWEVVDHQYREAIELITLNPLRSRSLLSEARGTIEDALAAQDHRLSKPQKQQLTDRLEEMKDLLEEVSGEHRLTEAPLFMDLSIVRPDTSGSVLTLYEKTMVILDRSSGVLLGMDVSRISAEAVGGGSLLSDSQLASVYAGRGFVLAAGGVVEVSLSGKTSALVVERDPEWADIIGLESFGGNLYLLDRGNGEIFRYQGVEGGFGLRNRWFGEGVVPNLSDAVDMTIDGDIWVLSRQDILHFRSGVPQAFTIAGLDTPFSDPIAIDTDPESERLYVLDRGNRRVVVFDKSGEYREQYLWDGIASVSDMAVSETEKKIFLLSGQNINSIALSE